MPFAGYDWHWLTCPNVFGNFTFSVPFMGFFAFPNPNPPPIPSSNIPFSHHYFRLLHTPTFYTFYISHPQSESHSHSTFIIYLHLVFANSRPLTTRTPSSTRERCISTASDRSRSVDSASRFQNNYSTYTYVCVRVVCLGLVTFIFS